jgi:hypothetical protein
MNSSAMAQNGVLDLTSLHEDANTPFQISRLKKTAGNIFS